MSKEVESLSVVPFWPLDLEVGIYQEYVVYDELARMTEPNIIVTGGSTHLAHFLENDEVALSDRAPPLLLLLPPAVAALAPRAFVTGGLYTKEPSLILRSSRLRESYRQRADLEEAS